MNSDKYKRMSDLISKLSELRSQYNCFDEHERDAYHTLSEAIKALSARPTAQQEVILCKECKHRPIKKDGEIMPPKEDDWKCPCLCDDYFYSWIPKDNFFCARGERREE